MDLDEALGIAFKVLQDWRVIAITVAAIIAFAALRYVGSVYSRGRAPSRARKAPAAPAAPAKPSGKGPEAGGGAAD
jgi:hypothetical protein